MVVNTLKWKLVVAFGALYLIWGSTYLAIRFALETLPPFTMTGARFVVAGVILYGWARLRGAPSPVLGHWPSAMLIGALLLLLGNGGVVWAEQSLSSGMTALIIATEPLFLVLLDWLQPGGRRPTWATAAGLILGFFGTGFLLAPWSTDTVFAFSWPGVASALLASIAWAAGSLYALHAKQPSSPFVSTGMQMFCGGTWLLLAGLLNGEWNAIDLGNASLRSWIAVSYLLVFGSIVAFSAYVWLLKTTSPARASTYAYINPIVAVLLGWLLAGEVVTTRMLFAMGAIIVAVFLILSRQTQRAPKPSLLPTEPLVGIEDKLCASE